MKKKLLIVLLVAVLAGGALWCWQNRPEDEGGVRIYFTVNPEEPCHGPAIGSEPYSGVMSQKGNVPGPRVLIAYLLAGPKDEDLVSPFPKGLTLESWDWDPDHKGNLQVRFSEQYSGLSDISLTLADYCVVLTLSQIPEVESVVITSAGYTANYRSHEVLRAGEAELTDPSDTPDAKDPDAVS